jgi:hypothetical protein
MKPPKTDAAAAAAAAAAAIDPLPLLRLVSSSFL